MEEKVRGQPPADWVDSISVAMGAASKDQIGKMGNRSCWRSSMYEVAKSQR